MGCADAGHAHADGGLHGLALPGQAQAGHALADALGDIQRTQRVGVRQIHHQHAAAKARQQVVGPQRGRRQAGDLDQHGVTGSGAVFVVQALEVVDIDHQQGRVFTVAADARPLTVGRGHEMLLGVGTGQAIPRGGLGIGRRGSGQRRRGGVGCGHRAKPGDGGRRCRRGRAGCRFGQGRRHDADGGPAGQRHQHGRHRGAHQGWQRRRPARRQAGGHALAQAMTQHRPQPHGTHAGQRQADDTAALHRLGSGGGGRRNGRDVGRHGGHDGLDRFKHKARRRGGPEAGARMEGEGRLRTFRWPGGACPRSRRRARRCARLARTPRHSRRPPCPRPA